jgi:hypothetical protein
MLLIHQVKIDEWETLQFNLGRERKKCWHAKLITYVLIEPFNGFSKSDFANDM